MDCVVNCSAYAKGRKASSVEIDDLHEVLEREDTFVWIGLQEPGDHMLKRIQQVFGLHDLAIEDAHRAHQRPKLEAYGEVLFIVLRTAQMNNGDHRSGGDAFFSRAVISW